MHYLSWKPLGYCLMAFLLGIKPGSPTDRQQTMRKVGDIPLPAGYRRADASSGSFGKWLRALTLKEDRTVHLYNGQPKANQSAQFAVIDIPVGRKDLQQCADAVMRMRAEYLRDMGRMEEIVFYDNLSRAYRPGRQTDRAAFEAYMEKVFMWCGTLSLEKQLKSVADPQDLRPGDVFIKGGSPGHAVMVMDMALSASGKKIFLLAQSYMPAQDIHILRNPAKSASDPWYDLSSAGALQTPEWTFRFEQRKRW
jgi:hypothetical protein